MGVRMQTYVIKDGVPPSGDPTRLDGSTIRRLIQATNPEATSRAGKAYETAARECEPCATGAARGDGANDLVLERPGGHCRAHGAAAASPRHRW